MRKFFCASFFFGWMASSFADAPSLPFSVQKADGEISVLFGNETAAIIRYGDLLPRHSINPLRAPGGTALTRFFPFDSTIPDEPHDHPHHTGVWMAHGSVNGTDYWTRRLSTLPDFPRIVGQGAPTIESTYHSARITLTAQWQPTAETIDLSENTVLTFSQPDAHRRIVDWDCTLTAQQESVVIGDTKEGFMAVRVAPFLNLKGKGATGRMFDSEGRKNGAVWGNPGKWVVYTGTSNGQEYALVMLDHPGNHGHPTHWHARDYGLSAANPFGLHDFKKGPSKAGDRLLRKGESLRFQYRMIALRGSPSPDTVDSYFNEFVGKIAP
jgi:hypothetical protein